MWTSLGPGLNVAFHYGGSSRQAADELQRGQSGGEAVLTLKPAEEEGRERWRRHRGNEGLVTASDLTLILSLSPLPPHRLASLTLLSV